MAKATTTTHAVVGSGDDKVTKQAVAESLKDILDPKDVVSLVWQKPIPPAVEAVYDYVMENEILFQMYYTEGENPARVFRESEHGSVFKVRDSTLKALESITGSGKVLFLWNDDENEGDETLPMLIDHVFDTVDQGTIVLDLTNGLSPIEVVGQAEGNLLDEAPAASRYDDEPEEHATGVNLVATVELMTKAELENMPARAVKAYGEKRGLKATTAKGIIAELFPEEFPDEPGDEPLAAERVASIKEGIKQSHEGRTTPAEPFITNTLVKLALQEVVVGLTSLIEALTPSDQVG